MPSTKLRLPQTHVFSLSKAMAVLGLGGNYQSSMGSTDLGGNFVNELKNKGHLNVEN